MLIAKKVKPEEKAISGKLEVKDFALLEKLVEYSGRSQAFIVGAAVKDLLMDQLKKDEAFAAFAKPKKDPEPVKLQVAS